MVQNFKILSRGARDESIANNKNDDDDGIFALFVIVDNNGKQDTFDC